MSDTITFKQSTYAIFTKGPINILLVFIPIALIFYFNEWSESWVFLFSLISLAPLAERLGYITEQLSIHTNETIGGLLNATFGNATELIVAITALNRNLYLLVKLSLLGSILSNLLLVLGCSFFIGGLYNPEQQYALISGQVNTSLLFLSSMGLLFPTLLISTGEGTKVGELTLSRATSVVLFIMYIAYLYFQLRSHRHLYESSPSNSTSPSHFTSSNTVYNSISQNIEEGETNNNRGNIELSNFSNNNKTISMQDDDDDDDDEEDELGFYNAIIWLAIVTIIIAILSDAISATIEKASEEAKISRIFISSIILPIVGNAAEHAGAVIFAAKNKVDLALGVAIGSSTQIALCVLPLLVIISWLADKPLDMNFGPYESSCLFLSVILVMNIIKDGKSSWLIGTCLISAYILISIGFFVHTDSDEQ